MKTKPISIKKVHEKVLNGDSLTDQEVLEGRKFFEQLSNDLHKAGPAFMIAQSEASRVYTTLNGFAWARSLIWIPDR